MRCASRVRGAQSGHGDEGLTMALEQDFDLLLLDLVLPGTSGLEILRRVREVRPTLPVIILSARGDEDDRVAGLKGGADDYVVKPFSVKELLARVEAVLRRSPQRPLGCRCAYAAGRLRRFRPAGDPLRRRSAHDCRNGRSNCCAIWRRIEAERSRGTSCWPMSGGSILKVFRPVRSTCTWLGCGRSCAMCPMIRRCC
jgi:DNA-binding response OmpR family regulator